MINTISEPISSVDLFSQGDGFSLFKGEIHIWNVPTDCTVKLKNRCLTALSEQERQRYPYFKFEKVQNNYIISQGMLRLLLAHYLNLIPNEINIGKHKKGKPYLIDYPKLRFNISNSGKRVVYAFSLDDEVGVDLEHIRELDDLNELIEKNFTPQERTYINKLPNSTHQRFFKFWTIKEAYLKAIGEGMRLPPDNLEFSVENGVYKLQAIRGVFEQEDWIFGDFTLENDYVGTLTYKNESTKITLRSIV